MRYALTALLIAVSTPAAPRDGITITFLANEGVMISDGTKKVLIDALFERYGPEFATPHDSIQRALAGAQGEYSNVDVILVTHRHGDHFHPAPMLSHLRANPRGTLVTSNQVVDSLMSERVVAGIKVLRRTMRPGERRRETVNGVSIELLGIPHGGLMRNRRGVEHLGYIVELGGRRILHLGDAGLEEETDFSQFRLDTARIDVALVPDWMVTNGRAMLEKWIKAKHVVAFHLGEGDTVRAPQRTRSAWPGVDVFVRSLETRRY
jgi:L-ascorbate metabolism protein UlaG (beta-lactamase superfamily)